MFRRTPRITAICLLIAACTATIKVTEDGAVLTSNALRECEGARVTLIVRQNQKTITVQETVEDGKLEFTDGDLRGLDYDQVMTLELHFHAGQEGCPYSARLCFANNKLLTRVAEDEYEISGSEFTCP